MVYLWDFVKIIPKGFFNSYEMDNCVLPEDFSVRMRKRLGERYPEFEASLSDAAPVSIRLNPAKWKGDRPDDPVPWCTTGYYLKERPLFTADPWFHGGVYYVQEAASMFLEQAFRQLTLPDRALVLDLCGAPGENPLTCFRSFALTICWYPMR